ncbi:MAG TPA: flagellar basal-body MS-ring/collar protein FliF [Burkholderiaceae bacterium]|nr:flagellar basal-body MS-ring/collar protein FliF [Burkholderiaceae bacterium]
MLSSLKPVLQRLGGVGAQRPAWRIPDAVQRQLLPMLLLASLLTALTVVWLWREQASYKPVFGARERVAAADMVAVLDAEHIPYHLDPDSGQVLVPESALGKARMTLAAKGVVAKLPAGLELMDHNDPLGVSQFVQDVRFRRGLEGELAQSIMSIDAVESARVHLSIAKSTSFVTSDGEKSSASVILVLKPGRSLSKEQIAAAIHLVAGSVATLDPQRVTLVDQAGDLLSAHVDLSEGFDVASSGNEAAREYEEDVRRNVHGLLAPVLGSDNYKVSVTAEVDNDRVQETREQYGAAPKVTSEATREERERDGVAFGVPGSLSNRPVAVAASAPASNTPEKSATTRQYAYDRHITQIKRTRARLQRMNVAVVLNAAGGWTPEQIANVDRVLRSGLGLNAGRGDQLSIVPMAFPRPAPTAPWWGRQDNQIEFARWGAYAVGTVLAYLLLARPLIRLLQRRLEVQPVSPLTPLPRKERAEAASTGETPALGAPAAADAAAGGVVPLLEDYDLPPPGSPVDVMVDHLRVLAAKEPERVAEVVKQWVETAVHAE